MAPATPSTSIRLAAAAELELRRRHAARAHAHLDDLPGFAEHVLGMTPWHRQTEVLTAMQHHKRVAIKAGRKVSKSTSLVATAIWWAYRGGKVLLTSSSYAQIEDVLWPELNRLNRQSGLRLRIPLAPETGVRTPSGGSITGRSVAKRENMQGYSGHDALYVIDEASGIDRPIFEAIEGNVAGGGTIVMAGNPTRLVGPFYDAFHGHAAAWHGITMSSRESPNVTGEAAIPGLAVPSWIQLMENTHGADGDFVAIHVDGQFPRNASNAVIPLALVEQAEARHANAGPDPQPRTRGAAPILNLGVDVARTGKDSTVVYGTRGNIAYPPTAAQGLDSYGVAQLVIQTARALMTPAERDAAHRGNRRPQVKIDVIGIGAGAYDVLARTATNLLEVFPVNVAESATSETYRLQRDQIWFSLRDWLQEDAHLPADDLTRAELIAPTFTFDTRGRYRVTSKDELIETLGRSPDRADALGLSVYRPPAAEAPTIWSV